MDTLDDVDIDDDVETELDVETLKKIPEDNYFMSLRFSSVIKKSCLNGNQLISFSLLIVGFLRQTLQLLHNEIKLIATLKKLTHLMMLILMTTTTLNLKLTH